MRLFDFHASSSAIAHPAFKNDGPIFIICQLRNVDSAAAGCAYAAYGGVYITASLVWLWAVEGIRPDRWDLTGAVTCLAGAAIILLGPRMG